MASICLPVCTLTLIEWRKFATYVLFVTLSNALHLINLLMHLFFFLVLIVFCDICTNLHLTALCQRLQCIWKHYVALAFVEVPQCIYPGHSYVFAYRYLIFQAVSATGENVGLYLPDRLSFYSAMPRLCMWKVWLWIIDGVKGSCWERLSWNVWWAPATQRHEVYLRYAGGVCTIPPFRLQHPCSPTLLSNGYFGGYWNQWA